MRRRLPLCVAIVLMIRRLVACVSHSSNLSIWQSRARTKQGEREKDPNELNNLTLEMIIKWKIINTNVHYTTHRVVFMIMTFGKMGGVKAAIVEKAAEQTWKICHSMVCYAVSK